MFGTYEQTNFADIIGDDAWDTSSSSPIKAGRYMLRINSVELVENAETGAVSFLFKFSPFSTEDGIPVSDYVSKMNLREYFYVGSKASGSLVRHWRANILTQFLLTLGITQETMRTKFNSKYLDGGLVLATLKLGDKKLSTRANPTTGVVPEVIDENDANTYVQFVEIDNTVPLTGVKTATGSLRKA